MWWRVSLLRNPNKKNEVWLIFDIGADVKLENAIAKAGFKLGLEYYPGVITKEELNEFQEVTNDLNFDKPIKKRYREAVIACPAKKQYFVFKEFVNEDERTVEPLALLTRNCKGSQGGGDFDVEYVNNKEVKGFKESPNFDKRLVCSWKDLEVEYLTEIPTGYEDITEKIKLVSIW